MNTMLRSCLVISGLLLFKSYSQEYTWTNIGDKLPNTISTQTISDIAIVGDSIWITSGYATYLNQAAGEIYFSPDRGTTFSIQTTKYGTHAICMLDSKKGWCGGVEGQLYVTSNGGATWDRRYSFGKTLMDIDFPKNCDTGFCVGFTGGVKMITPGGLVSIDMHGYVSNIYSVSCPDTRHAFIAGEEIIGPILYGKLQIDQTYPGTNGIYAIDMVDSLYGWCVGSPTGAGAWDSAGCMIIRATDGHEWIEQVNPVKGKSGTLMAVKAVSRQEAWTVGTSGVILHTTDGGLHWIREAEGLTNEMLYGIHVADNKEVHVTGNNRTVLRYGLTSSTHVHEVMKTRRKPKLSPNPSTGILRFRFNPNEHVQWINVLDFRGKVLFSKRNIIKPEITISDLPEGIYFLEIKTDETTYNEKILKK